jgi:hypothetical protein
MTHPLIVFPAARLPHARQDAVSGATSTSKSTAEKDGIDFFNYDIDSPVRQMVLYVKPVGTHAHVALSAAGAAYVLNPRSSCEMPNPNPAHPLLQPHPPLPCAGIPLPV